MSQKFKFWLNEHVAIIDAEGLLYVCGSHWLSLERCITLPVSVILDMIESQL